MPFASAIKQSIEVVTPDLIELRRDLHASPELSWHEDRTTDVVATWMDKRGVEHERLEGTGLVAEIGPEG
ncbi:MAG: amidohydrolase, partial [Actinomycetales bacterium]